MRVPSLLPKWYWHRYFAEPEHRDSRAVKLRKLVSACKVERGRPSDSLAVRKRLLNVKERTRTVFKFKQKFMFESYINSMLRYFSIYWSKPVENVNVVPLKEYVDFS